MSTSDSLPPEILEEIKGIFFSECEEQLGELETGLLALQRGEPDSETVNTIFRAAHSIKGGAGSFGFDDLVRFSHRLESVLSEMRSGRLGPEPHVLSVMFRASDVLADHVRAARGDGAVSADVSRNVEDALASLIAVQDHDAGLKPSDAGFCETPDYVRDWIIRFRPHAGLYAKANEPLLLLRELARLGCLNVSLDQSDLPAIDELAAEESYLCWTVSLQTAESESAIREVFEFVEGECDVEILDAEDSRQASECKAPEPASIAPVPRSQHADSAVVVKLPLARAPAPAATAKAAPSHLVETIRVDLERVDRLINLASELVVHEAMLAQRLAAAGISTDGSDLPLDDLHNLTRDLQDSVMAIRAQPVKAVFQRMSRLVREVEAATGKQVNLICQGESTEVDRTVIERLTDPLTHMIRNAIDHGIETAERRQAAKKPKHGTVRVSAAHRAGRIVIEVSDDGNGIDRDRVRAIACQRGLIASDAVLSDHEAENLIFAPGFSTAHIISEISGRGVGLDVVRSGVESLGGRISVASKPGEGTTFTLSLPLTLAVLDGMLVSVCGQHLIAPLTAVLETIQPKAGDLHWLGSGTVLLNVRGENIPLIDLGVAVGYRAEPAAATDGILLLVEDDLGRRAALLIDDVLGQRQVVIKSLQTNYRMVEGIAAATILGDGRVALILDINSILLSHARRSSPVERRVAAG